MKTTNFRTPVALGLAAAFLIAPHVDGQGFFGRKKKSQPVQSESPNLFPGSSSPAYVTSSEPSSPTSSAIFKSGQPEVVTETNYVLKDGVRVPATPKRRTLFNRNNHKGTHRSSRCPPLRHPLPIRLRPPKYPLRWIRKPAGTWSGHRAVHGFAGSPTTCSGAPQDVFPPAQKRRSDFALR